jgi:hypothetical protein
MRSAISLSRINLCERGHPLGRFPGLTRAAPRFQKAVRSSSHASPGPDAADKNIKAVAMKSIGVKGVSSSFVGPSRVAAACSRRPKLMTAPLRSDPLFVPALAAADNGAIASLHERPPLGGATGSSFARRPTCLRKGRTFAKVAAASAAEAGLLIISASVLMEFPVYLSQAPIFLSLPNLTKQVAAARPTVDAADRPTFFKNGLHAEETRLGTDLFPLAMKTFIRDEVGRSRLTSSL